MMGKTHRLGGVDACLGGYILLQSNGLLIPGIEPLLQLVAMYPFAIYGSTASDLDHHWDSAPSHDPISWCIWRVLHLATPIRKKLGLNTGGILSVVDAQHRSWQTHSDGTLLLLIGILWWSCYSPWMWLTGTGATLFALIMTGLIMGLIAHIFLDGITPEGIWCILALLLKKINRKQVLPLKYKIVPNKEYFATGNGWERLWNKLLWIAAFVMLAYIIYLRLPWRIDITLPLFGNR